MIVRALRQEQSSRKNFRQLPTQLSSTVPAASRTPVLVSFPVLTCFQIPPRLLPSIALPRRRPRKLSVSRRCKPSGNNVTRMQMSLDFHVARGQANLFFLIPGPTIQPCSYLDIPFPTPLRSFPVLWLLDRVSRFLVPARFTAFWGWTEFLMYEARKDGGVNESRCCLTVYNHGKRSKFFLNPFNPSSIRNKFLQISSQQKS